MIEQIVRRPVSVLVATVALCALGAFSLARLPLSMLPSIERPRIEIEAKAAASSRDELLHAVTGPIERRLVSVPGVTSVSSETTDGDAKITIESAWQTDPDRLRIDVARHIEGAATIPVDEMTVDVAGSDVDSVIDVAVAGASGAARTRIAQRIVVPELARIEGAGKIEVIGASPLRLVVQLLAAALAARGLTALDVQNALRDAGAAPAAGLVREGAAVHPVVVTRPIRSVEDLRAYRVGAVQLSDVAVVSLREVPDDTAFRMRDARGSAEGVVVRVHRAPGANAVALARDVRARVRELAPRLREVRLRVVADRTLEVRRALAELGIAALLGVLLGAFVLRWMLGRWRPTLALIVVVPAALLVSFSVFHFAGIALDVISLAGLALAAGLLVDNSIVVVEAIESTRDVVRGTRQIVLAVVASSITLMIVFAPLLYLRGLARAIFGEQAIAVVACIAASLLLSLTLTPVLSTAAPASTGRTPGRDAALRWLDRALANRTRAIAIALIVVLAGIAIGVFLPRELFARGASHRVKIDVRLAPDLAPDVLRAEGARVWKAVAQPGALVQDGRDITVTLDYASARDARNAIAPLRTKLTQPGWQTRVRLEPSALIESAGGDASRVEVIASAIDVRSADALAARVTAAMQQRGFRIDRHEDDDRPRTTLALRWNDPRRNASPEVRTALAEANLGRADVQGVEPEIRVLPPFPPNPSAIPVRVDGAIVPLSAVAQLRVAEGTARVLHDEGRPARRLVFSGDAADAAKVLDALELQGGERVRLAGHARELDDAYAQMRLAFVLAAILLYLAVAAFYESLLVPLLVMTALPFAGAGAIAGLAMTGQSLNVMSLVGLIFLAGVVVNHTVVLVDRIEQLRRAGVDEDIAIRRATSERYRPVLMTTLTAILGMLPLALAGGDGVELRRAIAIAVIGGLVTATIGTLVLIPLLHRLVEPLRRRRAARASVPLAESVHA